MKTMNFIIFVLLALIVSCIGPEEEAFLTIRVISLPGSTPAEDTIYLAGSFNDWDAAHPDYMLVDKGSGPEVSIAFGAGTLEYKFTRGSWDKAEGSAGGMDIENRSLTYNGGGGLLQVSIAGWVDLDLEPGTAAENVSIMDSGFYIPQLDRSRGIWIYLPPDYHQSTASYPVLYMHDGQNLFDDKTSFVGEWGVDEALNALFDEGDPGVIVVGVNHGGDNRLNEYSPWVNPDYGGGEGEDYVNFLIETLKPYVDANYRTLSTREHTGIMGSSMGGLISLYAAVAHQDVFSKAGVFSPSLWFSTELYDFIPNTGKQADMRFYILGSRNESPWLEAEMEAVVDSLGSAGFGADEITLLVHSDGGHSESYWSREFPAAYLWLYSED